METLSGLVILVVGIVLVILLLKILTAPIKLAFKLLLHALVGFAALFILNFFGSIIGITLALSWLNALVAGIFGIPGVIVLLILAYII